MKTLDINRLWCFRYVDEVALASPLLNLVREGATGLIWNTEKTSLDAVRPPGIWESYFGDFREGTRPLILEQLSVAVEHLASFLKRHHLLDAPARFDVVAIVWPEGKGSPTVEHFENAFEAVGKGHVFR